MSLRMSGIKFSTATCRLLSRVLLLLPLAGCVPYTGFAVQAIQQQDADSIPTELKARTYDAVDRMVTELQREQPNMVLVKVPTIVGSIADIADVNHSTPLGNTLASLVRTRLVELNIQVMDLNLRSEVKLSPSQGDLLLSRDRAKVYPPPVAGMICTGTYAVAHSSVFVSLKLIRATNAEILAAADFRLPRTFDVQQLLAGQVADAVADPAR